MKLRSLTLTNVRKFGGRTATLSEIGDGITVVSEANEFGKSTFFDAIHALFFEKFGASGRSIKSLQPHSGGGVRVMAQVETNDGLFQIEKRWLAQKGATVRDVAKGTLIASDGEAEAWIAALLGERSDGPAGLLWVRQGTVGLEPDAKAERENLAETRRDLLSSVAGEIDTMTGGRKMDRVMRRCLADLSALTTATGRPSGAWKTVQEQVKELSTQHEELERQCHTLAQALKDRRAIDEELLKLEAPEARAKREADVQAARDEARVASEYAARVAGAEQVERIAMLEYQGAEKSLATTLKAAETLTAAIAAQVKTLSEDGDAQTQMSESGSAAKEARAAHQAQTEVLANLRAELEASRKNLAAREAVVKAQKIREALGKAEEHRRNQIDAQTVISTNPVTPELLEEAESAVREVARLEAIRSAHAATVTLSYLTDKRVSLGDRVLEEGEKTALPEDAVFNLPGIGQMIVRTGMSEEVVEVGTQLAAALANQAEVLTKCGVQSMAQVRQAAHARVASQTAVELAAGLLAVAAPDGIESLRQQEADARALAETAVEDDMDTPDVILAQISAEEENERKLRLAMERADLTSVTAREIAAGAHVRNLAAEVAVAEAESLLGSETEREVTRSKLARDVAVREEKLTSAIEALKALAEDAPDLVTAKANLKRAEDAATAATKRRSDLAERRSGLSASIETQAERGIEERRDEIAGELVSAVARQERLELEVTALTRLRDVLEQARSAAREAYFGPVQEELAPLLRILHDDAALSFNSDTMLPDALSRGSEAEELETLSGGTKEQIAILTRLAFARLFAKQGRQMPIILDDALVYSDDTRIIKMFTALNRVADDQQILVFSCRQLAFADLGGTRPSITVVEAA